MVISTATCCESRALLMHVYPDGIKAYSHEHLIVFGGSSRYPVRRLHQMPTTNGKSNRLILAIGREWLYERGASTEMRVTPTLPF
jgi:hypothetical protein